MRKDPPEKFRGMPCSYVGTGCAYEDYYKKPFTATLPDGCHKDGYLSLDNMNKYIRQVLPIKKKLYYSRASRQPLKEFLKQNKGPMVICVLGHCIYAYNGDYMSFFDNNNDPVVCVWHINIKGKTYQSKFTIPVTISSKEEAANALRTFCRDLCDKDAISKFHCSGHDTSICQTTREEIIRDWSSKKDNKPV